MEITDQSFNIVDIKPANMEELTEVSESEIKFDIYIRDQDPLEMIAPCLPE